MTVATANGYGVSRAFVQVPSWGVPWVDVELSGGESLAGAVTLELPGATIAATVASGGVYEKRGAYRLAVGAGGWGREIAARGYADDAGVRASVVVQQAADAVGETVASAPTFRLPARFARPAGVASRLLSAVSPRAWRVDLDGVTRFGARAGGSYGGPIVPVVDDRAGGFVEFPIESADGVLPGVSFGDYGVSSDVELVLTASRFSARVYARTATSERAEYWRRIVASVDPLAPYRGLYEYRVVSQVGERLNLQAVRTAAGMPDLQRVAVRWPSGVRATHALGSRVVVGFIGTEPAVIGGESPDAPGWMPLQLTLGEDPALGVARLTDAVIAGGFGGTITFASTRVKAGL